MKQLSTLILISACTLSAAADGLESLETFFKIAQSGRAEFSQTVTAPARGGQGVRSKTSIGSFEFARPNRFKFVYRQPFEQSIVADGQTLWLYDVDLKQVTARQQTQVMGSTPAALIAAAPDLRSVQVHFKLSNAPDKEGLQWVEASPKAKDGQLQLVRVGFTAGQAVGTLAALEIWDSFGQRSLLSFSKLEVNPVLPKDTFLFKPPAGVDVIRQ